MHSFHRCERIRRLRFGPQVFFNGVQYRWLHLHISHVHYFIIIRQKFSSRASDSGECLLRCSSLCAHAYAEFVTRVNRRLICFLQCLYSVSCQISRRCFGCRFRTKIGASRASITAFKFSSCIFAVCSAKCSIPNFQHWVHNWLRRWPCYDAHRRGRCFPWRR